MRATSYYIFAIFAIFLAFSAFAIKVEQQNSEQLTFLKDNRVFRGHLPISLSDIVGLNTSQNFLFKCQNPTAHQLTVHIWPSNSPSAKFQIKMAVGRIPTTDDFDW